MSIQLYGIFNCSSVQKAKIWLNQNQYDFVFIDYKKQAPTNQLLERWLEQVPLDQLVNRQGTTWKKLSDAEKLQFEQSNQAIQMLIAKPTLLKRPTLVKNDQILVGFHTTKYLSFLSS
jgi:Spx/MgsR family transcriptional regulator